MSAVEAQSGAGRPPPDASRSVHVPAAQVRPTEQPGAEARAEYKQVTDQAIAEFEAARFAEARSLFLRAHELWPSARTLRTLGMTAFELRMYPRALTELQAALDDVRRPLEPKQRAQVIALLERTRGFVGDFHVRLSPADAELWLDGAPLRLESEVALVLAVGQHEVRARASGHQELRRTVLVQGRERVELMLSLDRLEPPREAAAAPAPSKPVPSPPVAVPSPVPRVRNERVDPPSRDLRLPLAVTAFGVGAAGVVVGAVMGGLALQRQRTLEDDDNCPNEQCPPAFADELSELKRFANTATAGAVIGAVGVGVGTYLWVAARRDQKRRARREALAPRIGLGSLALTGSF